jgi:hypothetical protein
LNNPDETVDLEIRNNLANLANQPEELTASLLDHAASSLPHKKTFASSVNHPNDNFPGQIKGRY